MNSVGELVDLSKIVRLSDWADAFAWHKWNAYVFSTARVLPIVSIASKVVLERHGMLFNEDAVFTGIKEADEIKAMASALREINKYPK
jgi:hypothetical protein